MKRPPWAALAVALGIGLATLYPTSAVPVGGGNLCILCGERGLADFILNVVLFTPFGLALRWHAVRLLPAALLGLGFTAAIEAAQVWLVAGRDASPGDLLANFTGTVVGWTALHLAGRPRRERGRLSLVMPPAAALLWVFALWLMKPDPQPTVYFTQWVADFGNMERYEGRVLGSRVGDLELGGPPWRIDDSDAVRQALRSGAPIGVTLEAGPPPAGAAPILSIYDEHEQEVFLLGADGDDVIYRERLLAHRIRLDQPTLRFPALLEGAAPGVRGELSLERDLRRQCAYFRSERARREACERGYNVADTWQLLYSRDVAGTARTIAGLFWMLGTSVLLALIAGGRTGWGALGVAVALLLLLPLAPGFSATPIWFAAAFAAGFLFGPLLSPRARRVDID